MRLIKDPLKNDWYSGPFNFSKNYSPYFPREKKLGEILILVKLYLLLYIILYYIFRKFVYLHTQALVSCGSTRNGLRWDELVFDPVPVNSYGRIFSHYLSKRRQQRQHRTFGDFPPEMVAAVTSTASGCNCTLDTEPLYLGEHHYPNLLPQVTCRDHQWCSKRVFYPVKVLTNRIYNAETETTRTYTLENLPEELVDQNWRFVQFNVTVACPCPN